MLRSQNYHQNYEERFSAARLKTWRGVPHQQLIAVTNCKKGWRDCFLQVARWLFAGGEMASCRWRDGFVRCLQSGGGEWVRCLQSAISVRAAQRRQRPYRFVRWCGLHPWHPCRTNLLRLRRSSIITVLPLNPLAGVETKDQWVFRLLVCLFAVCLFAICLFDFFHFFFFYFFSFFFSFLLFQNNFFFKIIFFPILFFKI